MSSSTSYTLYLDASGDPGWYPPDGISKEEWYVFGGLALFPHSDHKAHIEVEKIIRKHIPSNMLETIPIHEFEINYSHIIYGKKMYKQIMKQMLKTLLGFTITGTLILFVVAITTTNINKSYSQSEEEEVKKLTEGLRNCIADDYLVNQTNIKIIDILLVDTINNVCIDDVNQLLEKDYTIKGTLQDRFVILEKIK